MFAYSPASFSLPQHRDALVERLARDEPRRADAHPVLLHEPLQAAALSGRPCRDGQRRAESEPLGFRSDADRRVQDGVETVPLSSATGPEASQRGRRTGRPCAAARRSRARPALGEDVLGERRLDDPGALVELVVELARAPAGVPGEDARAPKLAERVRIDLGREEADRVEDERRRAAGSAKSARTTIADG